MSAFWAEGVRRKIPASKVKGELLDAMVSEGGIVFFGRNSQHPIKLVPWSEIAPIHHSAPVAQIHGPLRIVPADERE